MLVEVYITKMAVTKKNFSYNIANIIFYLITVLINAVLFNLWFIYYELSKCLYIYLSFYKIDIN